MGPSKFVTDSANVDYFSYPEAWEGEQIKVKEEWPVVTVLTKWVVRRFDHRTDARIMLMMMMTISYYHRHCQFDLLHVGRCKCFGWVHHPSVA